jgi:hypothetical protein
VLSAGIVGDGSGQRLGIETRITTPLTLFDTTFINLPQNARLTNNGVVVQTSYAGGDGNDVELTVVSAPPGSNAAGINAIVPLGDGTRQITGVCLAGQSYVLEAATNLSPPILWLPLLTNTASASGELEFIDTSSTNFPTRFYRVKSQ